MIQGRDIVCLSSLAWSGFPTSRHHIARLLARHNRVLFVDPARSIGRVRPRRSTMSVDHAVTVLSPPSHLPFGTPLRQALTTPFNQIAYERSVCAAVSRLGMRNPVVWNVFPVYSAARLAEGLDGFPQFLHMTDSLWDYEWYGPVYERSLRRCLERAAFVVGSSPEIVERLSAYGKPARLLEHGVDADLFEPVFTGEVRPHPRLEHRARPRIGFVGGVDHRLDGDALAALCAIGSVTLVGPQATGATAAPVDALRRLRAAGAYFEGAVPYAELPSWHAGLDVAVMPYVDNSLVRRSNPLKILEYLASGLPVVATDVPATRRYSPALRLATSAAEFVEQVKQAAAALPESADVRATRREIAQQQSWERRTEELSAYVQEFTGE